MSGCDNTDKYSLTVTVDPSDGGTISPAVGTHDYEEGTEVEVTAIAADGYVFDQWSGAATGNTNPLTITMTADTSAIANFALAYDLAVDVEAVGAGDVTLSEKGPYKEDSEVTLTAAPADGYIFDHWSGDVEGTTPSVSIDMSSDKTVTAHFDPVYDLTVDVEPVGTACEVKLSEEGPYKEDTEVILTAAPADGYIFNHWSGDAEGTTTSVGITMTSDKTVTAHFDPVYDLTVDVDPVEAGDVTLSEEGPYKEDTEIILTAEPADGYVFDNWSGDAEGNTLSVSITMTSDKTVTANFAAIYNLTVNVPNDWEGEVTLSEEGPYTEGTEVTLTATSADGYVFDKWSGDVEETDNPVTITMDSDKTVTANFTTNVSYNLTVIVLLYQGTVEISTPLDSYETNKNLTLHYAPGTPITLFARSGSNSFWYWSNLPDDIRENNPATFIMDSDMTITAVFRCNCTM